MADVLALEALYDAVAARFTAEGTLATNVFGWREPGKHFAGARIAWIPGDPAGNAGSASPARNPGRNPRPIATFLELFTVEISTSQPATPENERAQYRAVRLLRDAWHRAVYHATHGTIAIRSEVWIVDRKERRFGAALRLVCELEAMVPDQALEGAPVDTGASIQMDALDIEEQLDIAGPPAPEPDPDPEEEPEP
jgi:hypothetical protein